MAAFIGRQVHAVHAVLIDLWRDVAFAKDAENPRLREHDERARAGDRVFDGVADQSVVGRDDERGQQHAQSQTPVAEAEQGDADGSHQRDEFILHSVVAAQNRHEPIEDWIGQRTVDEKEQTGVE